MTRDQLRAEIADEVGAVQRSALKAGAHDTSLLAACCGSATTAILAIIDHYIGEAATLADLRRPRYSLEQLQEAQRWLCFLYRYTLSRYHQPGAIDLWASGSYDAQSWWALQMEHSRQRMRALGGLSLVERLDALTETWRPY